MLACRWLLRKSRMSESATNLGPKPTKGEPVDPRIYEPLYGKQGLVDGDIIAYRCAFVAEHTFYLVEYKKGLGYRTTDQFESSKEAHAWCNEHEPEHFRIWTRKEIQ